VRQPLNSDPRLTPLAKRRLIGLPANGSQQLVLPGFLIGATDARESIATGLRQMPTIYLKMRLQCRKTLRVEQYCPSHNWSYNARVLKA
jgi:hypothetical protein